MSRSLIVRISLNVVFCLLYFLAEGVFAQTDEIACEHHIVKFDIVGDSRTKSDWLERYVELKPGCFSNARVERIRQKLLSTEVFLSVTTSVVLDTKDSSGKNKILRIELDEKWTFIPVVRGAYGGGTPLLVMGAYNTHAFGRLWTVGSELQKYGDSKPGFVIWAKAPRFIDGKYLLGSEYWDNQRYRTIYIDEKKGPILKTASQMLRLYGAIPLATEDLSQKPHFFQHTQVGLDVQIKKESRFQFDDSALIDSDLKVPDYFAEQIEEFQERAGKPYAGVYGMLIYDDIDIDLLRMDGFRATIRSGSPGLKGGRKSDFDGYYFKTAGWDLNLASHLFLHDSSVTALNELSYIGGLDAVRGFPDNFKYGNKSYFANVELRHLTYRSSKIHLQSVGFLDSGAASFDWHDIHKSQIHAVGLGVRLAIPRVNRLVFRFDIAKSIGPVSSMGISLGLNQFFQPYRPL